MKESYKIGLLSTGISLATVGMSILEKNIETPNLYTWLGVAVIGFGAVFAALGVWLTIRQAIQDALHKLQKK